MRLPEQQPVRLRERKKQATAERLYRTALMLFRDRGYESTTVEAIAQAAEVAKGTFFHYFPTKEAVLSYVGQRQMRLLHEALAGDPGFAERPVKAQLTLVFETLAAGIQDEREALRVVSLAVYRSISAFATNTGSARALYDLLLDVVRRGQERGELRADPAAPAESMALLLLAAYFYTFLAWLELEHPPALVVLLQVHLDLLLHGMQSP